MRDVRSFIALLLAMTVAAPAGLFAASHREAPLTALDPSADITDFFAFVSYDDASKVTFILNVNPFLEPSNGPNYFPFDPDITYSIKIDNTYDAVEDISFEFKFTTNIRAPQVFTGFVGALTGLKPPANAPLPPNVPSSAGPQAFCGPNCAGAPSIIPTPVAGAIPPAITTLDGAGSDGLSLQQTYTVTMVKSTLNADPTMPPTTVRTDLTGGQKLVAVPSNVGPRTMPCYAVDQSTGKFPDNGGFDCSAITPLAKQGIYSLGNGVRVFAGTVDDPFYIDLGAAFDSLNFRAGAFGGNTTPAGIVLPILTGTQDVNDRANSAPDAVSGFNVNSIAIEVPASIITTAGRPTIGSWGATSRPRMTVRPTGSNTASGAPAGSTDMVQVQRMGNALINELIVGTGFKNAWSLSVPSSDSQFANFALDPLLARVMNTVFGLTVPDPPRTDLLPLVTYGPPIAAAGTPAGPIADLLRLNTSIAAATSINRKRLGFIAGDTSGYPNGRRVSDDVTDISLRVVAGILCSSCKAQGVAFNASSVPALGDGVNTNDVLYQETFPYVAFAHSGLNRRHVDPGETACAPNCPR